MTEFCQEKEVRTKEKRIDGTWLGMITITDDGIKLRKLGVRDSENRLWILILLRSYWICG